MPFLQIEHLTRVYGTGDAAVRALDDVSLTVERGEFVAVMGASGSGKSTFLHLLGGVDTPTEGCVTLDGVSLYDQKEEALTVFRRRQIGLVYQFYNLVPLLTVEENLTLPLLLDGRRADPARVLTCSRGSGSRKAPRVPGAALGRPATARRHCARSYHAPGAAARGRAHGQPRFRRGRGRHADARPAQCDDRPDHRDDHARRDARAVRKAHRAAAGRPHRER